MLMNVHFTEGFTGGGHHVLSKGVTGLGILGDIFNRVDLMRGPTLGDPVARTVDFVDGLTREEVAPR
jgi:hypothetical protein